MNIAELIAAKRHNRHRKGEFHIQCIRGKLRLDLRRELKYRPTMASVRGDTLAFEIGRES